MDPTLSALSVLSCEQLHHFQGFSLSVLCLRKQRLDHLIDIFEPDRRNRLGVTFYQIEEDVSCPLVPQFKLLLGNAAEHEQCALGFAEKLVGLVAKHINWVQIR